MRTPLSRPHQAAVALLSLGLSLTAFGAFGGARGAVVPTSSRDVELAGGGTLRIATRFEDNEYLLGAPLAIEPLLGAIAPDGLPAPQPLGLIVTLERRGFAPCLAPEAEDAEFAVRAVPAFPRDCAAGTAPEVSPDAPTGPFQFRFDQLFQMGSERLAPVDGAASRGSFGTARFRVNMRVRAANGEVEDVRFPVTVTVRESPLVAPR